jgi:hypothetical protein
MLVPQPEGRICIEVLMSKMRLVFFVHQYEVREGQVLRSCSKELMNGMVCKL